MDVFDSRALTHPDGYYHHFTAVGMYKWGFYQKGDFQIQVTAPPSGYTAVQHDIEVAFAGGEFLIHDGNKSLTVIEGDHVLWRLATNDPGAPSMVIAGDNDDTKNWDTLYNQRMDAEDAFSHLFQSIGTHNYVVSENGAVTQVGEVQVTAGAVGKPEVVTLTTGSPPNPAKAVVTLQTTVIWDVDSGKDVAVYSL
ncbi:hypothetical protein [Rhizobium leguminosarum]|uniref:hypothetical protein n=1 Tax=Rhizobium leguminosarum TaxID=384 RepID=UPI0013DC4C6E|nr:hypothetical protein [Rhizobium leguminosarum]NEK35066.1 hypothetical protein [Rhizobium leguminosarum]